MKYGTILLGLLAFGIMKISNGLTDFLQIMMSRSAWLSLTTRCTWPMQMVLFIFLMELPRVELELQQDRVVRLGRSQSQPQELDIQAQQQLLLDQIGVAHFQL